MSDEGSGRFTLDESNFYRLSEYIDKELGIKMPITKRVMLEARLQKRLKTLQLKTFAQYCDYLLSKDGQLKERKEFFDCVTTNKTDFFREDSHFDFMTNILLPELAAKKVQKVRIWSSACSSGEEPYTLAIVMEEFKAKNPGISMDYSILATDISTKVLAKAKAAVYNEEQVSVMSDSIVKKYFKIGKAEDRIVFEVNQNLKSKVKLGRFNLMSAVYDVPGPFEIVFCRNVLIYFDRERQIQILTGIMSHLVPDGTLFLGHSESMAGINLKLKPISSAIYKRQQ